MSKHTPGPWTLASLYDGKTIYVAGSDHISVASLRPHPERTEEARAANARLIAAAPEMLDGLVKAADTFADLEKALGMIGHPRMAEACAIAGRSTRDLIAKAEAA